jgi:hypothetical protein
MTPRLLFATACLLSLSALAAAPPKPIVAAKAAISDDQMRGWEAVGKLLLGEHAMLRAREACGAATKFELAPEAIGPLLEGATGLPLAQIEAGAAAPGWMDHLAAERVDKLLGGGACDADSASFIASELDGLVALPASDLRTVKDLGKVPVARWPEFTGAQREHQTLAFGQFNEFVNTLMVADDVAKHCAAGRARVDALMAKADAATSRFAGVRTSEAISRQLKDPNADHMNANMREQATSILSGGCGTPEFEEWLADTETAIAALVEKSADTPVLPMAWRDPSMR